MNFDVIVIGSGVGGLLAAKGLSKAGKKVCIIEKHFFGGVVYNVGSTRKKELVTLAQHFFLNKQYRKRYINNDITLDWQQAMEWIDSIEDEEDKKHQQDLKKAGVTTIFGEAKFVSPYEVNVDGIIYHAKQFIIASGAVPRPFSFKGAEYLSDSSDFLTQKELPKQILFVGAGIISFAFMTIASAFGSEIEVLQHDAIALKNFDQDFVSQLIEINKKRGVKFYFNNEITQISSNENQLTVQTKNSETLKVDKVYNLSGRVPQLDNLGLDKIGVSYESNGIITDAFLKTNHPHIYACGDCSNAQVPKLANYSAYQAQYIVQSILNQNFSPIKYPIPSMSIFSEPRIAQVGVTTTEALLNPTEYSIEEFDLSHWLDSKRKVEELALMKTVVRNSDNHLVGATAISHQADLLINYITLLLNANVTKEQLENQLFAYPSLINEVTRFWK